MKNGSKILIITQKIYYLASKSQASIDFKDLVFSRNSTTLIYIINITYVMYM